MLQEAERQSSADARLRAVRWSALLGGKQNLFNEFSSLGGQSDTVRFFVSLDVAISVKFAKTLGLKHPWV